MTNIYHYFNLLAFVHLVKSTLLKIIVKKLKIIVDKLDLYINSVYICRKKNKIKTRNYESNLKINRKRNRNNSSN